MQVARQDVLVNAQLANRLNIGGRWYVKGDIVPIDKADFEILESRGFVVKTDKKPKGDSISAEELAVVTKEIEPAAKEHFNGQRPNKKR